MLVTVHENLGQVYKRTEKLRPTRAHRIASTDRRTVFDCLLNLVTFRRAAGVLRSEAEALKQQAARMKVIQDPQQCPVMHDKLHFIL